MHHTNRHLLRIALCCGALGACGGLEINGDAGDATTTPCISGNYAVCGGPQQCSPSDCKCIQQMPPANTGVCSSDDTTWPNPFGDPCFPGVDGRVCVLITDLSAPAWVDAPYELGELLANDGAAERVRYADLGLWTGEPIPLPTTCPNLGTVQACGGMCGTCPSGQVCVGRSPLHPVGFCDANHYSVCSAHPTASNPGCINVADDCFTYVVQPAAQAVADNAGKCFPASDCKTLALNIPGGGSCSGAN